MFGQNVVSFGPVLAEVPGFSGGGFSFNYNFPGNHVIVDDFALELKFFDSVKSKIVGIVSFLILLARSCD